MLIFSKDRPLQLDGLLRSIRKHYTVLPKITVLLKREKGDKYDEAYYSLSLQEDVKFVFETDFEQNVRDWLSNIDTDYFCFSCDDVLINREVNMEGINTLLTNNPAIFSYSIRLGEGITYCQPSKQKMEFDLSMNAEQDIIVFDPHTFPHSWDWGYPFEVTGTIYHSSFGKFLLSLPQGVFKHPNIMEGPISAHLHAISGLFMACNRKSSSLTITVNRVQDIAKNEIFDEVSTEKLLELWNEGKRLDIDYYIDYKHNSICIGDLKLC
jgi:hypothetical protein